MQTKLQRSGLILALLLAATWAGALPQESEPLAPELLAAEKVFVKQTLIDPKIVSRFRAEIGKLERFEVVLTEEEADLVATLSAVADYTPEVVDSGSADTDSPTDGSRAPEAAQRPIGTVRVLEDLHLRMVTPDDTEVWTDSVPIGNLIGNASKKLAKRLADRLADEG